jgi:hypothetical protein
MKRLQRIMRNPRADHATDFLCDEVNGTSRIGLIKMVIACGRAGRRTRHGLGHALSNEFTNGTGDA